MRLKGGTPDSNCARSVSLKMLTRKKNLPQKIVAALVGVKISSDQRNLSSQPEIPGTKTNNMVRSPYIYFPSTLNINSRRARHTYAPHT